MGEYLVPTSSTSSTETSQPQHPSPAMTLVDEPFNYCQRSDTNQAASTTMTATTASATGRTWSRATVSTGTLLTDAVMSMMKHSSSTDIHIDIATTTTTSIMKQLESEVLVDGTPATTATIATALDAATVARQKRRRKVQLLRHLQQRKKSQQQKEPQQPNQKDALMTHTALSWMESTTITTTTTATDRPPLPRLMQSLLDQASHHDRKQEYQSPFIAIIIPDAKGLQDICHRLHDKKECVAIPTECTYEMIHSFQYSTDTASVVVMDTSKPSQPQPYYVYIPNVSILESCPFWKRVLPKKSYAIRKEPTSTTAVVSTFNETVHVVRRLSTKCWPGPILIYVQVSQPIDGLTVTVPRVDTITGSPSTNDGAANETHVQHYIAIRKPCHPLSRKVCTEYYKRQFRCRNQGSAGTGGGGDGSSNHSSCTSTPSASPMFMSLMTPDTPRLSSVSSRLSSQQQQLPPPPFMLTPPYRRVESNVSLATSTTSSSLLGGLDGADGDAPVSPSVCDDKNAVDGNVDVRGTTPMEPKNQVLPHEQTPQPFLLVGTPMKKGDGWNQQKRRKTSHHHNVDSIGDGKVDGSKYVHTADEAVAALSQQQDDAERSYTDSSSNNNGNISAVLHGEERYELLSVPTCMYQEPYSTSIWIDSTNRMIRIKSTKKKPTKPTDSEAGGTDSSNATPSHHSPQQQDEERTMSPHSTIMRSSNSFLSLQQEQPYDIDEASILQSLRAVVCQSLSQPPTHSTSPITAPSPSSTSSTKSMLSPKERVLHAVLLKWNVVTEQ